MQTIKIKPISVNQCWQGKRFKTKKYKEYEGLLLRSLKPLEIPEGRLSIEYVFGFSSSNSDLDNPIKPFQDILCKRYGFDDKRIFSISVEKILVKKGEEFVAYKIKKYHKM